MIKRVLVSVRVVSYNAERTIIETLNSIKNQTYQDIELIISDDCSKDNTVEVTSAWLKDNESRFTRTKLLTADHNTGVCANMNRATKECRGEWIKGIAADDILLPNCISDFVDYVEMHPSANWVSSYLRIYNNTFDEFNCIKEKSVISRAFFDYDADQQLLLLAASNKISAPTQFIRTAIIESIGGYEDTYGFEDYVFSLNALEHGIKCEFLDKETVGYRIHNSSFNTSSQLIVYNFHLKSRIFHKERCFKYLTKQQVQGTLLIWKFEDLIVKLHCNKKTRFMSFIYNKYRALCRMIFGIQ